MIPNKESSTDNNDTAVKVIRVILALIGLWTFVTLTNGLISGSITYSVGEIDETKVVTSEFWHTLLVYLTFCCPFGIGLMIAGFMPELYKKYKLLLPGLLIVSFVSYIISSIITP